DESSEALRGQICGKGVINVLECRRQAVAAVKTCAGWNRSADDTGGDFYDWKKLADGRWVVVLADVTGHGIGPAILASVCRAYSRASFNVRDRLETILKNINQAFAEDLTSERFATFVAAVCEE